MIVSINSNEYRGTFKCKRKVRTIAEVDSINDLMTNYSNLRTADAIIYKGNIDDLIETITPDNAKDIFVLYCVNPDIINLQTLNKLSQYNVLCRVPEGYSNMEQLYTISTMHPNVRFCGGKLLKLDGVQIGVFSDEKPKRYIFTDNYGCQEDVRTLQYLDDNDIAYEFTEEKIGVLTRQVKPNKSKGVGAKAQSKVKKQLKYNQGGLTAF